MMMRFAGSPNASARASPVVHSTISSRPTRQRPAPRAKVVARHSSLRSLQHAALSPSVTSNSQNSKTQYCLGSRSRPRAVSRCLRAVRDACARADVSRRHRDARRHPHAVCRSVIGRGERVGLSGAEPRQYRPAVSAILHWSAEDSPTPSPLAVADHPQEAAEGQDQLVLPLGRPSLTDVSTAVSASAASLASSRWAAGTQVSRGRCRMSADRREDRARRHP